MLSGVNIAIFFVRLFLTSTLQPVSCSFSYSTIIRPVNLRNSCCKDEGKHVSEQDDETASLLGGAKAEASEVKKPTSTLIGVSNQDIAVSTAPAASESHRYPSTIIQDDVGKPLRPNPKGSFQAPPSVATGHNMIARRGFAGIEA